MSERLSVQLCPGCGRMLDGVDCLTDPGKSPVRGDVTVCIYCGIVLRFDAKLVARRCHPEALRHITRNRPELAKELSRIRAAVLLTMMLCPEPPAQDRRPQGGA